MKVLAALLLAFWLARGEDLPAGAERRFGSLRLRHGIFTSWVGFTPDGGLLSSGGEEPVQRWDPDGSPRGMVCTHELHQTTLLSGDGKRLVTETELGIAVWDAGTGKKVGTLDRRARVGAVDRQGARLALADDDGIAVVDVRTGKTVWRHEAAEYGEPRDRSVALSADGKRLVMTDEDRGVTVLDVRSGARVQALGAATKSAVTVAFVGGSDRLVFADRSRAWCWSRDGGVKKLVTERSPGMSTAAFATASADGRVAAFSFSSDRVFVVDLESGRLRSVIEPRRGGVSLLNPTPHLAFSPDGTRLAIADGCATVRLWDVKRDREHVEVEGHAGSITSVAMTARATTVVSIDENTGALLWDGRTGHVVRRFGHPSTGGVDVSRDGRWIALGDDEGVVHVRRLDSGRHVWKLKPELDPIAPIPVSDRWSTNVPLDKPDPTLTGQLGQQVLNVALNALLSGFQESAHRAKDAAERRSVGALRFSPDGRWLASDGPGAHVHVWDTSSGKLAARMERADAATRLEFASDGRALAAGTTSGELYVWDLPAGSRRFKTSAGDDDYQEVKDLRFCEGGTRVAWASEYGTFVVADARDGQVITRRHVDGAGGNAIAPDGDTIAVGDSRTITIESLRKGTKRATFAGHLGDPVHMRFTDDGTQLLSAGLEGLLFLWAVPPTPGAASAR